MINKRAKYNRRRHLSIVKDKQQIEDTITNNILSKTLGVAMVSSYPPRECGIATFSVDLENAMKVRYGSSISFKIYALQNTNESHDYENDNIVPFNTDHKLEFLKIAKAINHCDKIDVVLIQHEFGLFRKNEDSFLEFLASIDKPIILTFHTVLPEPNSTLLSNVRSIAKLCTGIIVMTQTSANFLVQDYGVESEKISIVIHGTHLVATTDKKILKEKYGLSHRRILSTFGLLGPGKNIETTLYALPTILEDNPDVMFLILGKTHPGLVAESGESYRESLLHIVEKLNLHSNVKFVNNFIPLNELLEYLQLTDIYIFSSKDPNQAVSGTFAYALSCGCPIISTPIPHAIEVLQNGSGRIMAFEDSNALSKLTLELLNDNDEREKMRCNGLAHTLLSSWENTAIKLGNIFKEAVCEKDDFLRFNLPEFNLQHVFRLTDDIGMIQFSNNDVPDIKSGYTLDDNSRALIALCEYYELTYDPFVLTSISKYATFIQRCQRFESGFYNYVNDILLFTAQNDEVNLEDANGRAIWGIGRFLSIAHLLPSNMEGLTFSCKEVYEQTHHVLLGMHSPRAIAFAIKGIYFASRNHHSDRANTLAIELGQRLRNMYRHHNTEDWNWFESHLTYGNAVMPEAMLLMHTLTGENEYLVIAKNSMDFLIRKTMDLDGIHVVPNTNWNREGQNEAQCFKGGEQPIDVSYMILALETFHKKFPESEYSSRLSSAFSWFLGNNALKQIIYNPRTGGCHDGLELTNVNLNQGAESTLSYLLARLAMERMKVLI